MRRPCRYETSTTQIPPVRAAKVRENRSKANKESEHNNVNDRERAGAIESDKQKSEGVRAITYNTENTALTRQYKASNNASARGNVEDIVGAKIIKRQDMQASERVGAHGASAGNMPWNALTQHGQHLNHLWEADKRGTGRVEVSVTAKLRGGERVNEKTQIKNMVDARAQAQQTYTREKACETKCESQTRNIKESAVVREKVLDSKANISTTTCENEEKNQQARAEFEQMTPEEHGHRWQHLTEHIWTPNVPTEIECPVPDDRRAPGTDPSAYWTSCQPTSMAYAKLRIKNRQNAHKNKVTSMTRETQRRTEATSPLGRPPGQLRPAGATESTTGRAQGIVRDKKYTRVCVSALNRIQCRRGDAPASTGRLELESVCPSASRPHDKLQQEQLYERVRDREERTEREHQIIKEKVSRTAQKHDLVSGRMRTWVQPNNRMEGGLAVVPHARGHRQSEATPKQCAKTPSFEMKYSMGDIHLEAAREKERERATQLVVDRNSREKKCQKLSQEQDNHLRHEGVMPGEPRRARGENRSPTEGIKHLREPAWHRYPHWNEKHTNRSTCYTNATAQASDTERQFALPGVQKRYLRRRASRLHSSWALVWLMANQSALQASSVVFRVTTETNRLTETQLLLGIGYGSDRAYSRIIGNANHSKLADSRRAWQNTSFESTQQRQFENQLPTSAVPPPNMADVQEEQSTCNECLVTMLRNLMHTICSMLSESSTGVGYAPANIRSTYMDLNVRPSELNPNAPAMSVSVTLVHDHVQSVLRSITGNDTIIIERLAPNTTYRLKRAWGKVKFAGHIRDLVMTSAVITMPAGPYPQATFMYDVELKEQREAPRPTAQHRRNAQLAEAYDRQVEEARAARQAQRDAEEAEVAERGMEGVEEAPPNPQEQAEAQARERDQAIAVAVQAAVERHMQEARAHADQEFQKLQNDRAAEAQALRKLIVDGQEKLKEAQQERDQAQQDMQAQQQARDAAQAKLIQALESEKRDAARLRKERDQARSERGGDERVSPPMTVCVHSIFQPGLTELCNLSAGQPPRVRDDPLLACPAANESARKLRSECPAPEPNMAASDAPSCTQNQDERTIWGPPAPQHPQKMFPV